MNSLQKAIKSGAQEHDDRANGNNAPTFDPLNPSDVESAEMIAGYLDGHKDRAPPRVTSAAYDHGRRNGVSDRTGNLEADQLELAARYVRQQRDLNG